MNRDLSAAAIQRVDSDGCVVHIHALRHSFGTHHSRAGVAPREAQTDKRHSDISLTINTNTDARLLDTAEAIESLGTVQASAPRMLAPTPVETVQNESIPDHSADIDNCTQEIEKAHETQGFIGFPSVGATGHQLNFLGGGCMI